MILRILLYHAEAQLRKNQVQGRWCLVQRISYHTVDIVHTDTVFILVSQVMVYGFFIMICVYHFPFSPLHFVGKDALTPLSTGTKK